MYKILGFIHSYTICAPVSLLPHQRKEPFSSLVSLRRVRLNTKTGSLLVPAEKKIVFQHNHELPNDTQQTLKDLPTKSFWKP